MHCHCSLLLGLLDGVLDTSQSMCISDKHTVQVLTDRGETSVACTVVLVMLEGMSSRDITDIDPTEGDTAGRDLTARMISRDSWYCVQKQQVW